VYVIHAAIASLHTEEPRDWAQIAALYGELVRITDSAVVELNRAIAVAEVDGVEAGLALVDRLELDGYQYFHSTRADLLRRLGHKDEARAEYDRALLAAPCGRGQSLTKLFLKGFPSQDLRSSFRRHPLRRERDERHCRRHGS
jgi:predicted RNA polymerase sigma factor